MAQVWRECFDGFEASLTATLTSINQPTTVLAGPLAVIRDLGRRGDLSQVTGVLPVPDAHLAGATLNGLRVLSFDELRPLDSDDYQVVVCAFSNPDAIAAEVRARLGDDVRLSVPTCQSRMDYIDSSFRDRVYPSKGLVLQEKPRGRRRVRLAGQRVVVYGAGAGGREAVACLEAQGVSPFAVCDGDAGKAGSTFGQYVVATCADIPRDAYNLVVIASRPGYAVIAARLMRAGLRESRELVSVDDLPVIAA